MGRLLSTQTLLDILGGGERMTTWFNAVPANEVQVSAVSIGQALELIQQISDPGRRMRFEDALDSFVAVINSFGDVVDFDEASSRRWAHLQGMDLPYVSPSGESSALGAASRMVVATALAQASTFVEPPQPYHQRLPDLQVEAP